MTRLILKIAKIVKNLVKESTKMVYRQGLQLFFMMLKKLSTNIS